MKKLLVALCLIGMMFSVPAMADRWTFTPNVEGDADHITLYHAPIAGGMTAQEFIDQDVQFTPIDISATAPTTFEVTQYPVGSGYAFWGEAVTANNDRIIMTRDMGDGISPMVWQWVAKKPMIDAHFENVESQDDGTININMNVNVYRSDQ